MEEPVKSFQFRADGSRAPAEDAPHPWQYSLAELATLYDKYKAGDWLPGALVRMCQFDHPRILTNPKHFIFRGEGDEVEIMEPYDHYRDGPRCVLGDAEAHQEWKKRVCADYKTRDELLSREELRSYAETGDIPREDLAAFPLMPPPPSVVIDSGKVFLGELYKAHREFKIEVKATSTIITKPRLSLVRGAMYLFKGDDDPGCARGYVEIMLRRRIMLEDNTFSLNLCSFEVRKQAYMANEENILRYKARGGLKIPDLTNSTYGWRKKLGWAAQYQSANNGISLTPPRKTSKKKKKRKRESPPPPEIKYHKTRGGAARASERGLQLPQIAESYEHDVDVMVISASKFRSLKDWYITEGSVPRILNQGRKIIVIGKLTTLSMRSFLALCNARVVSKPVEIKNLHLLIQWLPLWWDYPKHKAPQKALPMPDLRSSLETFLRTIPPADEYGNDESDLRPVWIRQLINGAKHLPLFVTACENKCEKHALDDQNFDGTVWDYRDVQISI